MGRELKRVPLDFNYPLNKVWEGYCPSIETFRKLFGEKYPYLFECKGTGDICRICEANNDCTEEGEYCLWHNQENKSKWLKEVPAGEGYQLWSTTSEGSPVSPVFKTAEELAEYCEENCTTWGSSKATKEEWLQMLEKNFIYHVEGNVTFI